MSSPSSPTGQKGLLGSGEIAWRSHRRHLTSSHRSHASSADKPGDRPRGVYDRTTRGLRIYLAMPRLRELLALSLDVSAAGSVVIVNTVVLVQAQLRLTQPATLLALALFGARSMTAAFALPRLRGRLEDRRLMRGAAACPLRAFLLLGALVPGFSVLLPLWFCLDFA